MKDKLSTKLSEIQYAADKNNGLIMVNLSLKTSKQNIKVCLVKKL